jgi:hypothetical protein
MARLPRDRKRAASEPRMSDNSATLHENPEQLRPETIDHHRAIVSLMEELEAVDWYDQRIDAAGDQQLKQLLAHNRDEEKEHAAMVLEWLRRHDAKLDEHMRTYLFTDKPLLEIEHEAEHGGNGDDSSDDGCLNIGGLRASQRSDRS